MKKRNVELMHRDTYMLRYADGVPATVRKQYWSQSPWSALYLLLRRP